MFVAQPVQEQIGAARNDRLRVLVVGAGVAGVTLAQLLRAEGLHPVLIERAPDHADAGYMLALMPLADPAMRRLGLERAYCDHSIGFRRYFLHGRHGQLLREYAIGALLTRYGNYRGIARGALLHVLAGDGLPVSYRTTLHAIRQDQDGVHATLRGGDAACEAIFDAVVLADGLHSAGRALLLPPEQITEYDTGWGGWVAWMGSDAAHADRGDEIWGADFFVGIYPVKDRVGVIVAGDNADTRAGPRAFIAHLRRRLRRHDGWVERALVAVEAEAHPYYWRLTDCRSATWAVGRVALLGDAAAGFLPTAGIGAAMAMESATVLARLLAGTARGDVAAALRDYERAQKPRVEAAQDNSRDLARLMFRRGQALAALRDLAARFISLRVALRPILRLLESAPES